MSQPNDGNDGALDFRLVVGKLKLHAIGGWRFRWIALVVAWATSIGSWIGVYLLPDRYEASAQVFIDTDTLLRPLLKGLSVEEDVTNSVSVMIRTMLTRPHLERVARESGFDRGTKTPREIDAFLASLERRINVTPLGVSIYKISFQDEKRTTAIAVVDKLLSSFVEDIRGSGQQDSQQADETLKSELNDYERRLTESESRLKEFKRINVGLLPTQHGDYYAQLQAAEFDLAAVQQSYRVANEKAASLKRQLAGEEPAVGGVTSGIDDPIDVLEQRRSDLLVEYTAKHPEVVRIDQMLAELYSKRDAQRALGRAGIAIESANPVGTNPVYQNLKIQQSKVQVEIASLGAALLDKQTKADRLRKQVDVIPQVEAALSRLDRDYEVVKARYLQMLQRWEDLQTGKRVKASTEQVQFRILDPPFAAVAPAGPPRAFYLVVGFILSLVAGVGVAVGLDVIRPVLHQPCDLRQFGWPVLGTISVSLSREQRARARVANVALASAGAALLTSLGVVIALASVASKMLRDLV